MSDSNPTSPDTPQPPEAVPTTTDSTPVRPPRRPVYEPSLLPERRRRRASPWIVIPGLVVILVIALYLLLGGPRHRRFVPSRGKIAIVSDSGSPGHPHLWMEGIDGSGAQRLTKGGADEASPSWSSDGSQIAFLSSKVGGVPQVFVVDADGQNLTQITQNGSAKAQPAFAVGDPNLIGFTTGGALQIATLGTTGIEIRRLLPGLNDQSHPQSTDSGTSDQRLTVPAYVWSPAKSRDSQGLAAVEGRDEAQTLAVMPSLSGPVKDTQGEPPQVSPLAAADTMSLAWSPDGGLLAVAMLGVVWPATRHPASGLLLFDGQGNLLPQQPLSLLAGGDSGPQNPVFSPDGTQIVFEVWHGVDISHRHSIGLFVMPTAGGSAPHVIVRGDATHARFTPDGQALLFLRGRTDGGHDLCRVGLDGSGVARLSDGTADVSEIVVSPQSTQGS